MSFPVDLPAFDDLAQHLDLTVAEVLERIASDERLMRVIEDKLSTVRQIEQDRRWVQMEPPERKTDLLATLTMQDSTVCVRTREYCDRVVGLVKTLSGSKWEPPYWVWHLAQHQLPTHDRYVELAHRLLHRGVPVRVYSDYAERIQAGDWRPAIIKQVSFMTGGPYSGWFALRWNKEAGDYWTQARQLPNTRYERPYVIVAPQYANEVADFADAHGFDVTPAARAAIERAEREILHLLGLAPLPATGPDHDPDTRPVLEAEEVDIDDELRDEPL